MAVRRSLVLLAVTLPLTVSCRSEAASTPSAEELGGDAAVAPPHWFTLEPSPPVPQRVTTETLFEHVVDRARSSALTGHLPQGGFLPKALASLSYEQYRVINFRPEASLWQDDARFAVQLLHPGFLYQEPVRIHVLKDGNVVTLPFDRSLYRYDSIAAGAAEAAGPQLGYAGFRVYYPVKGPDYREEIVVFLGASYFRLLGSDHVHGLSSRGLAVDVAQPSGEEFPAFREFWLVQPTPEARSLTFFALLEGPSVTGAYRFELEPGFQTALEVEARLFARRDVAKLGVAPLTSMFLYGPNGARRFDDFRPQVHDSDGLMMHTGGDEWIWRPLSNGLALRVTSLRDDGPRGFGLLQRDRDFGSYLDLEAQYHRRPSEWVALGDGDWGRGGVELVEIPTDSEFKDNIVAYWAPDQPFRAGEERVYRYRLVTLDRRLDSQTLAQVERTRIGWVALPGETDPPPRTQRRFVVDFVVEDALSPMGLGKPEAVLETTAGSVSNLVVQPLPDRRGWRATFELVPDGNRPSDMRLFLETEGERLTETWSYVWYPDDVG